MKILLTLLNETSLSLAHSLASVPLSWTPLLPFNQQNPTSSPKPIGSTSPSLRNFFQLFTFPLAFWRMQWFSLAMGLHSSGFLGSPVVGLSVSKCKSVFDPVPAPWGQRLGFFTASLQHFSSTIHQSRVSFYHLPRKCSVFPNKVALNNKAHRSIENENWSSLLLSQFFYYWHPLLSLMPLFPEASLYKHKLTPIHKHISLLFIFFLIAQTHLLWVPSQCSVVLGPFHEYRIVSFV